jgi:predicted MFS family arabinose efflux permease
VPDAPASAGGPGLAPRAALSEPTTRARVARLLRLKEFRTFFTARALSQVGDGMFQFAAVDVLLLDDPGARPVAKLFALTALMLVPFSVAAPFTGVFIDRCERRTIVTRVPLLRALVAAALPLAALWGTGSVAFIGIVLVVLSANRFFLATMSTVLPQLVDEDDLLVANSVASTGGSVATVIGLGIGSVLAAGIGGTRTALFAAAAFAFAAVTAHRMHVHRGLPPHKAPLGDEIIEVVRQLREGLSAVRRDARVRYAMTSISMVQLLVGATTGTIYYAFIIELDLGAASATGALAALAVGIAIGIVFVPAVGRRIRHDALVPIGLVIAAAGATMAAVGTMSRGRLTLGTFFVGISYAFAKIPVDTIVQEQMADQVRGRAFSAYDMLFNLARVSGVGLVALAYEIEMTTSSIIGWIAAVYLVSAGAFAVWERRAGGQWTLGSATLLQPGELVTVRAYAGYRADEEPRALVIAGRELAIDSVDWRAVVEQDGIRARVFVCRIAGARVRLAQNEDGWRIERVTPLR